MRKMALLSAALLLAFAAAGCSKRAGGSGGGGFRNCVTAGVPIRGHDGQNTTRLDLLCETLISGGGGLTRFAVEAKDQTVVHGSGTFTPALPGYFTQNWSVKIINLQNNSILLIGNHSKNNPPEVPILVNTTGGYFTPLGAAPHTYIFQNAAHSNESLKSITVDPGGGAPPSICNGSACAIELGFN